MRARWTARPLQWLPRCQRATPIHAMDRSAWNMTGCEKPSFCASYLSSTTLRLISQPPSRFFFDPFLCFGFGNEPADVLLGPVHPEHVDVPCRAGLNGPGVKTGNLRPSFISKPNNAVL